MRTGKDIKFTTNNPATMEGDRQKSEFNMAVSYLNRLNALFYVADESAIELDTHTWFHSLLAIYRELSTEAKPSETEAIDADIETLRPLLNLQSNQQAKGRTDVDSNLYRALHNLEIKLRVILRESGLQLKLQEDALKALR